MLIGNPKSFAIEYALDENFNGTWLYGKLCYWIGGNRVGDFDLGTSLGDVLIQMQFLVKDADKRDGGSLCGCSPKEIFGRIDSAIYGSDQSPRTNESFSISEPARFDISIPVDIFDNWKIYLLDCAQESNIYYMNTSEGSLREFSLRKGEFDAAISEFYDQLDQLYERESLLQKPI
jgi:hypothetical protein